MYSGLNNVGYQPRRWNAAGSTDATNIMSTTTAMPMTGTGGTAACKGGCTTCQKKRMACLAAGVIIGVVATMLLSKKAKAD